MWRNPFRDVVVEIIFGVSRTKRGIFGAALSSQMKDEFDVYLGKRVHIEPNKKEICRTIKDEGESKRNFIRKNTKLDRWRMGKPKEA